jgi:hypothetical protein
MISPGGEHTGSLNSAQKQAVRSCRMVVSILRVADADVAVLVRAPR